MTDEKQQAKAFYKKHPRISHGVYPERKETTPAVRPPTYQEIRAQRSGKQRSKEQVKADQRAAEEAAQRAREQYSKGAQPRQGDGETIAQISEEEAKYKGTYKRRRQP